MTREEFRRIDSWYELMDFAYEHEIYLDEVFDEEEKDSFYNDRLRDWAADTGYWKDLLDALSEIPEDYDYYILDEDEDRLYPADDEDLEIYKEIVEERIDWDEEEEEDEEPFYNQAQNDLEPEDNFEIEDEEELITLFALSSESVYINTEDDVDIMQLIS